MTENKRHQVVVIGSGFGGLFGTKALKRADVDVTMIAKTTHHLFQPLLYQVATGILSQGEIAPPTREILADQENARVLLGEVTDIDMEQPRRHLAGAGPGHHHAVRLADRRRRRRAVLLRQRPLRRARARHEEHRRRPRAARPDLRRLRARRAGRDRGGDRAAADLRRRRRRPDRGRDGRADRRAGAPHAAQGLPPHQHPRGARSSCSTPPARCCRPSAPSWARRPSSRWRSAASPCGSARWSPTSTSTASSCKRKDGSTERIEAVTKVWAAGRAGVARWPRRSPSRAAPRSTAPAASASTPTSRCPATPRSSWSAT